MALNPSNSSNLEQLALKRLTFYYLVFNIAVGCLLSKGVTSSLQNNSEPNSQNDCCFQVRKN